MLPAELFELDNCRIFNKFEGAAELGDKYIQVPICANTAQLKNGTFNEDLSSDLVYFADTDDHIPLEELKKVAALPIKFKIFGERKLYMPQYVGRVSMKDRANIIASALVVIDYNENVMHDVASQNKICITNVGWNPYDYYTYGGEVYSLYDRCNLDWTGFKGYKDLNPDTYYNHMNKFLELLIVEDVREVATI